MKSINKKFWFMNYNLPKLPKLAQISPNQSKVAQISDLVHKKSPLY